jgi:hypothetical protein
MSNHKVWCIPVAVNETVAINEIMIRPTKQDIS